MVRVLHSRLFISIFVLLFFSQRSSAQCPFTTSGVVTNITCFGFNNGAIDLSIAGGSGGGNPVYCLPTYSNQGCACPAQATLWDFINNFSTTGGSTNISNLNSGCNGTFPNNYTYFADI